MRIVGRLTRWLMQRAAAMRPELSWTRVDLVLTDDAGITPLNGRYFGKARPTDVISFRFQPVPGGGDAASGEIYVNVERAAQVAGGGRRGSRELALYIAHGMNHLAGESDHTPLLRARMRRRELAWLREAARLGHVDDLLPGVGRR